MWQFHCFCLSSPLVVVIEINKNASLLSLIEESAAIINNGQHPSCTATPFHLRQELSLHCMCADYFSHSLCGRIFTFSPQRPEFMREVSVFGAFLPNSRIISEIWPALKSRLALFASPWVHDVNFSHIILFHAPATIKKPLRERKREGIDVK